MCDRETTTTRGCHLGYTDTLKESFDCSTGGEFAFVAGSFGSRPINRDNLQFALHNHTFFAIFCCSKHK